MWKIRKSISCMLVFCFVLSFSAIGYTAPSEPVYQITQEELNKLEANLKILENNYKLLLTNSSASTKDLMEALTQLSELKEQLRLSKSELKQTQESLTKAQTNLKNANELFAEYAKEEKLKQNKLRIERDVALLGVIYLLVRK